MDVLAPPPPLGQGDADGERVIAPTPAADGWRLSCKFSPWEPAGRE